MKKIILRLAFAVAVFCVIPFVYLVICISPIYWIATNGNLIEKMGVPIVDFFEKIKDKI